MDEVPKCARASYYKSSSIVELEYKQLKRRMFPIDKNILWNDIINEGENIYETYTTGS